MKHFNELTPAEAERLSMLFEEAAEIIQIAGKIFRHGYDSYHPHNVTIANTDYLENEIGDFLGIMDKMIELGDVDGDAIDVYRKDKWANSLKYTHHQEK